jgi:hypothetical protein
MNEIRDEATEMSKTASSIANSISSIQSDSLSFREQSVDASTALQEEAQKGMDILTKQNNDLVDFARRTNGGMEQQALGFENEIRGQISDHASSYKDELYGVIGEEIQESLQDLMANIYDTSVDAKEEQRAVREGMVETQDEDDELKEESEDLAEEVSEIVEESADIVKAANRKNLRAIAKTKKKAIKGVVTIKAQADKAKGMSGKEVKRALKDLLNQIKDHHKSWLLEATEVKNTNEDRVDETAALGDAIKDDFYTGVRETRKQNAEMMLDMQQQALEGKGMQLDAADSLNTMKATAKKLWEVSNAKLSQTIDRAKQSGQQIAGDLDGQAKNQQSSLQVDLASLEDKTKKSAIDEGSRIENDVSASGTKLSEKVVKGSSDLEKGMFSLVDAAKKLGAEIDDNENELNDLQSKVSDVGDRLDGIFQQTKASMAESANNTLTNLNQVSGSVNGKLSEVSEQLKKEAGAAGNETRDLAKQIYTDLEDRIESLRDDAVSQLTRSARSIATATERGEAVIKSMAITASNIEAVKTSIVGQLPQVKEGVKTSVGLMRTNLEESQQKLQAAREASLETVEGQNAEFQSLLGAQMSETRYRLNTKAERSSQQLEEKLRKAKEEVEAIREGSDQNNEAMKKFDAKTIVSVNEALNKVKYVSNQERTDAQTMNDKLGQLAGNLHSAYQAALRGVSMMKAHAEEVVGNTEMEAIKHRKSSLQAAEDESSAALHKFGDNALNSLDGVIDGLHKRLYNKATEVSGLDSRLLGQKEDLDNTRAKSFRQAQNLLRSLQGGEDVEKEMEAKERQLQGSQQNRIKSSETYLKQVRDKDIAHMTEDADAEGRQAISEAQVAVSKVAQHGEEMHRRVDGFSAEYLATTNNGLGATRKGTSAVSSEVEALEQAEREGERLLNKKAGSLESQVDVEEDKVKRMEVAEKEAMADGGGEGVAELRGASQLLGTAKDLSGAELTEIGDAVQAGLEKFRGVGQGEAAELSAKVDQLIEAQPDFGGMFTNDTVDARDSVDQAHKAVEVAENWAKKVVEGFDGKLDGVRGSREGSGAAIHDKASKVKKNVVAEAEATVKEIGTVAMSTEKMEQGMRLKLQSFRTTMNKLGGTEVDHDKERIDSMQQKLFQLQQNHQRVMSWANMHRHKNDAWKDAVEKHLHKLGQSIVSDDTELQGERLDAELSLNNGLRNIGINLQNELTKTGGEEARTYEHLAAKFGEGIADLMHRKALNEMEEEKATRNAYDSLQRKGYAENKAVMASRMAADVVDNTVSELTKSSKMAAGAVAALKLPLMSVSDENIKTREKYDTLNNRLNRLVAGSAASLLQEGEQSSEEKETMKEKERAQETVKEIASAKALNDVLFRQNMKLAQQNTNLEEGLTYVRSLPAK